jgi:hypothetical protein
MRGERDTTMLPPGSSIQENVELLRRIITEQNKIIREKGCQDMPKMLALYKEVEEYYYGGDGVRGLKDWEGLEDTILLLSDDNFANVRTLPTKENRERKAGWGLYYHFDYHGSPISYEWVNSTPLPKIWEQLTMAYEYGIRDLWIVNVGDIRPDELPLSYYMALAYNYEGLGIDHPNSTDDFLADWIEQQFGGYVEDEDVKKNMVSILKAYTRMNGNRRPEAVQPDTYHPTHYGESDAMLELCYRIQYLANDVNEKIPDECRASYYGLVYYPAVAGANVQLMNLYAGKNHFYAENGLAAAAKDYEKRVETCIAYDKKLTDYYNNEMADGKWKGMMSSAHICFENWNDEGWHYPETVRAEEAPSDTLAVCPENGDGFVNSGTVILPEFTNVGQETHYFQAADGTEEASEIRVRTATEGVWVERIESDTSSVANYAVRLLWDKIEENREYKIVVKASGQSVAILVKPVFIGGDIPAGTFIQTDGIVSIEAEHYQENKEVKGCRWCRLDGYGKTLSSMKMYPLDVNFDEIGTGPSLAYPIYIREEGEYTIRGITAPTNNLEDGRNMRYALSVDDGEAEAVKTIPDRHYNIGAGHYYERDWAEGVLNNCHYGEHKVKLTAGLHTLRFFGVEAGLVLQKIEVYKGKRKESYFGAAESCRVPGK